MKNVALTATALIALVTAGPHASPQLAKELQPSMQILTVVTKPMPDFDEVTYYEAFPDSQGQLVAGIGHSSAVRGWFRQMTPIVPKFVQLDREMGLAIEFYTDTIREEGEKVLASAANLRQSIGDLDSTTLERVKDLLQEYNREVRKTREARSQFNAASEDAKGAGFLVEAREAGATQCNLELQRARTEAEKAALLARIAKHTAFLNAVEKVIDTVKGGPQSMVAYASEQGRDVTKAFLIEVFHSGTRETLYEIGAKLEAIDKALDDVKCKEQGAALKAAKANLEARLIEVVVAFGRIFEHRANAWTAVNRLGTLQNPKTKRTPAFFENLKRYNEEANVAGHGAYAAINTYLTFLSKDPLARGPLVLSFVKEDYDTVQRERAKRDPSGVWSNRASETKAYLGEYAAWYEGETTRGQRILADLREGKHLDFVDLMMARAMRELGIAVDYKTIIL